MTRRPERRSPNPTRPTPTSRTATIPFTSCDATLTGLMLSFVFYLLAFIWCFACRSAWRAWLGVLLPSLVLGLLGGFAYWMKNP